MVRIITDSSSTFTKEEGKEMDIDVLSLRVNIGDMEGEDLYVDMDEFYGRIAKGEIPRSSQPAIGEVVETFEKYPEDEIINISMADGLSGTYESACSAKEMVNNKENITVFNTRTLCGPQRYMVEKAVKMRNLGKTAGEILEWLKKAADSAESFLIPQDFAFLKRGGRLTSMSAAFGTVLSLKPIMTQTADGRRLDKFAIKRNMKKAVKTIVERMLEKGVNEKYIIYVSHANAIDDAKRAIEQIKETFSNIEIHLLELGAAFVTQGGPQCIAIQYIEA
ncbi:MAG: DegV family protein [Lachnospiraceae bacterium]|nr:DegV family protein [Lachnospiraceae bacterium]